MNFIPKDKKFAKVFKFRFKNEKQVEHRSIRLIYGNYGLKAMTPGPVTGLFGRKIEKGKKNISSRERMPRRDIDTTLSLREI